ncbi:D-alanyl-D-alanine carboxypeptidase (penicillin-binding protein 5/6) [Caloramator quimbayensis]|uniref:D-alanyl-D-alanine carboxypeptidase (Penicillin-binding protein 5/6) n=1 Tax=Caloramator quimbayensis TaxID=1147123 RepID=A0A1T4XZJ5_9CLOT|nr:D-alanyl-D-alanine carboxypeptidase family protein [Caloramator quimbayensis]SKA94783.1 D-alanyl-D-alanine carboxypeptidase (penicillin-binding protein 5/6) [Caloramator quimbayensis]
MKRKIFIIILFIFFLSNIKAFAQEQIDLNSKAAVLMEYSTGRILYDKNKDRILNEASITKIMTYYVLMDLLKEKGIKVSEIITANSYAIPSDATRAGFRKGERITINELINSMLIHSANDSALQLGEFYKNLTGKDISDAMNEKAKEIGLKNTFYINPTGLKEKDKKITENYTTAMETAILARNLLKEYPEIIEITSKKEWVYKNTKYKNTNKLLNIKKEVDGIKTGHTDKAGYCLLSTEKVNSKDKNHKDFRIIAVVLGADTEADRIKDSKKILEYGEKNYEFIKTIDKNEIFKFRSEMYKNGYVEGRTDNDKFILKKNGEVIEKNAVLNNNMTKKIRKGDEIGKVVVKNTTTGEIYEYKLYSTEDFKPISFFRRILLFIKKKIKIISW